MIQPTPKLNHITAGSRQNPAIVLLHGFMGSTNDWQFIQKKLAVTHFVIIVDLPGHGNSCFSPADCHFETAETGLIQILDNLNIKKTTLVGYSMGGRFALWFTTRNETRVTKLCLESTSPGMATYAERELRRRLDIKWANEIITDLPLFLDNWYKMPLFKSLAKRPDLLQEVLKSRSLNDTKQLANSLLQMGTGVQASCWPTLKKLQIPIQIIVGEFDKKYQKMANQIAAQNPLVVITVIESAGHNTHLEAPLTFWAAIQLSLNN